MAMVTGARHLMAVYQIYDSLLTHAFLWRYNFRAIILAPSVVSYRYLCVERPRMAPKLWRQSYGAKGMHAFIDYQRSVICYHQMSSACGHGTVLPGKEEYIFIYGYTFTDTLTNANIGTLSLWAQTHN